MSKKRLWLPRNGRALSELDYKHQKMEEFFKNILYSLPKFLLKPLWGIVVAALITFSGRSELQFRIIGILLVALWLSVDLWAWLIKKNWQWKFIVGWTSTHLLVMGAMGVIWWWVDGKLEDERQEVKNSLVYEVELPNTNNPFFSDFTVRNNSSTEIGWHKILCKVHAIAGLDGTLLMGANGNGMAEGGLSKGMTALGIPAHSADTVQCLEIVQPPVPPSCMDITLTANYSLTNQPEIKDYREWRLTATLEGPKYRWSEQTNGEPGTYCFRYLNPEAQTKYRDLITPQPS